jgi:hypothetical protein
MHERPRNEVPDGFIEILTDKTLIRASVITTLSWLNKSGLKNAEDLKKLTNDELFWQTLTSKVDVIPSDAHRI